MGPGGGNEMNMGYAEFVWSSYAVFWLGLIWAVAAPLLQRRRVQRELQTRHAERAK